MKPFLFPLFTAAVLAWLSAGCASSEGVSTPENTAKYDLENREKFVLMDKGAQRSITYSSLQDKTLADGRLEVTANVRNRENRRLQVQINCEFKDEQGFAIDSTPWQTLILTENGQESVRFTAMNTQAKRFTVRVREAR